MNKESPAILAIETATSACSVALAVDDAVYQREQTGNNIHSQVLLTMVQEVLQEANIRVQQLDAVAVGQGPGSFTGLRIGVGVAQGIAYGAVCPMIGVASLDALAQQASVHGRVLAGIDARMGEVYWCQYTVNHGQIERGSELQLAKPETLNAAMGHDADDSGYYLVGNAWQEYADQLPDVMQSHELLPEITFPRASAVLALAKIKYAEQAWVSAVEFAPEYVRNEVAKKSQKRTA